MGSILSIDFVDISFEATWAASPPPEAHGLSLPEFIQNAATAQCYDAYHSCADFCARYERKFGREPYISPRNKGMWDFAKGITREERDLGFHKMEVYRQWFTNTIFTGKHSNALVMMPLEAMGPRYRDEVPTFRRPPQDGINALGLGPVMKSPVLAVPIDEISYKSRVSNQEEKLPFVIALMARQGYDIALMETTKRVLEKANKPTVVKTGRRMYEVSEVTSEKTG
ncbi:hypothetical protein B0T20DRAFT_488133 [Sordaria brevicollis]|uniref:Uncharacterized protein n=1 Tax=Sordaria brevicollis TaxID=83679 RepID=A0AAE0P2X2_SORBR|nr:hypothetical protein B0T20DRAFT_488133 [Sordaria brevicollis]